MEWAWAFAITDTWPCLHGLLGVAGKWLRQQGGIFNFSVLIFSQHPSLCPWTDEKMINTSKCISQALCLYPITSFQRSANWQNLTPWSKARLPDIYDLIFILIINKQNSIKIHSSFHQIPSVNSYNSSLLPFLLLLKETPHTSLFKIYILNSMYVLFCVWICEYEGRSPHRPEDGIRPRGVWVAGCCEPPNMSAEDLIRIILTSEHHSSPTTSTLQSFFKLVFSIHEWV